MTKKNTLVLGASLKPERYSFQAIHRLRVAGHPVHAIGGVAGQIGDVVVHTQADESLDDIDTVSMYLQAGRQHVYEAFLLALRPKRVLFNPGTENPALSKILQEAGIATETACTLVLLSTDQY